MPPLQAIVQLPKHNPSNSEHGARSVEDGGLLYVAFFPLDDCLFRLELLGIVAMVNVLELWLLGKEGDWSSTRRQTENNCKEGRKRARC